MYFVTPLWYNVLVRIVRAKNEGTTKMGYTHYWNVVKPLDAESFKNFVEDVKKVKPLTGIRCTVIANQYEVVVNGSCESLVIQVEDSGFDFCKTNQGEYDVVVTTTLLLAKKHFGDSITVSSDGGEFGFAQGKTVYQTITGEAFPGDVTAPAGVLNEKDLELLVQMYGWKAEVK